MAQNGFHGLFGLLVGPPLVRSLAPRGRARRSLIVGFVLGNLLPDLDWVPLAMVWPADRDLALTMHRGFTHSLVAAVLPLLGLSILTWITRDPRARWLGWGLALGTAGHIALDLVLWFSGLDLLWPLGHLGYPSYVNLWAGFRVPLVLERLLAACEFVAYSVFYTYLMHLARQTERNLRYLPALRRLRGTMLALTGVFLPLALVLDALPFQVMVYGFWAIVAFPAALYMTVSMAPTLHAAATDDAE